MNGEICLTILMSLPDAVLALDQEKRIVFANSCAYDYLGKRPDMIVGRFLGEAVEDRNLRLALDALDPANYLALETEISYPRKLQLKVQAVPVREEAPGASGLWLLIIHDISRDVSDRKSRERQESLEKAGRMSAQMAHELGNRLNPIVGQTQMLQRNIEKLPPSETRDKALERISVIKEESMRIRDFVKDFLSAARPKNLLFEEANLGQLCKEVLDFMRPELERNGVCLEERLHSVPNSFIDKESYRSALINVLKNAQEAMPEGGMIIVTLECQGGEIRLAIRDTGCGMSRETLSHAFEPFYTTKEKGHGLGMLQIRQAMEAHGGSVDIKSLGKGTTVTLVTPVTIREPLALDYGGSQE